MDKKARRKLIAAKMLSDPAWQARAGRMMFHAEIADYKFRNPQDLDPKVIARIVHCGRVAKRRP